MDNLAKMEETGTTIKNQNNSMIGGKVIRYVLPATWHFTARFQKRIQLYEQGNDKLKKRDFRHEVWSGGSYKGHKKE